jgi:hypothetical protein
VLTNGVVRSEEGAKVQTRHGVVSWLRMMLWPYTVECPAVITACKELLMPDRVAEDLLYQIFGTVQREHGDADRGLTPSISMLSSISVLMSGAIFDA